VGYDNDTKANTSTTILPAYNPHINDYEGYIEVIILLTIMIKNGPG
jgi:hypothetical protein